MSSNTRGGKKRKVEEDLDKKIWTLPDTKETRVVKLGVVQHIWDPNPETHMSNLAAEVAKAAKQGAQLILLQELTLNHYVMLSPSVFSAGQGIGSITNACGWREVGVGEGQEMVRQGRRHHRRAFVALLLETLQRQQRPCRWLALRARQAHRQAPLTHTCTHTRMMSCPFIHIYISFEGITTRRRSGGQAARAWRRRASSTSPAGRATTRTFTLRRAIRTTLCMT